MPDSMTDHSIASCIDHALLHPTMTDDEIRSGCELANRLKVASVCVKPYAVPLATRILKDSPVKVGTVIGFPHGSHPTPIKAAEAEWCCQAGAVELDMVINIGKAIQGDWDYVSEDIRAVASVARKSGALLKVIFETDYLTDTTIQKLCDLSVRAGADFVKTSTGFGFRKLSDGNYNYVGATTDHVTMMRDHCPATVRVKASGGIRSFQEADRFRQLGATRLGTSASEAIVNQEGRDESSY